MDIDETLAKGGGCEKRHNTPKINHDIPFGRENLRSLINMRKLDISRGVLHKNPVDNFWYVPFPGADRPVVNRTQRFQNETYKTRPAQFQAYFGFPYMTNALATIFIGSVISFLTKFSPGQKLLLNHPKFFTLGVVSRDGPSEENMKNTTFMVAVSGEGWNEDEQAIEGKAPTKKMRVEVIKQYNFLVHTYKL